MMEIKIKYFTDVEPIAKKNNSDWHDLRAAERVELKQGEFKLIPLGVGMILPDDYEANIVPRSSTFKTWGIIQTNSVGLIDNTYCGDNDEWKLPVIATREIIIPQYTRIAQFRISENQPLIFFNRVDKLGSADRNGFGSTGTI